ncbi:cytochrome P450 [Embleya sp. NPDC056575]|uniref:cytochrome P450 n=1 Tax=unclassified Embleya TaxID=2699296 RepID=UPI0036876EC0
MPNPVGDPVAYPFNEAAGLELSARYAEAQQADGLERVRLPYGEPAWLVTRYADARLVLGDARFSRAACTAHDEPREQPGRVTAGIGATDPPDHTRLRKLVAKAFTVQRIERLRPGIRALAERLAQDMADSGPPADLVESFALPLPVAVICRVLGVPEADRPLFRKWSDDAVSSNTAEQVASSMRELSAYMVELIAEHRVRPADDLITELIEARDIGERLSEAELVEQCMGLLIAGHEATAMLIPNFVHLLLGRHHGLGWLRDEPDRIPAAVEELLRFVPLRTGALAARWATEEVEVGGTPVREGEPVMVSVGAANHDARRFTAPDVLDLGREGNRHVAFGHGVHHCVGAPLARLELQEALRALALRMPSLHPAGDVVWKSRSLVRGPHTMPVGW